MEVPPPMNSATSLTGDPPLVTLAAVTSASGPVSAAFVVGAKGRVVLPASVRRAAHIEEGAELVARPLGKGRVLLETRDAVRARVWGAAPAPADLDAVEDVRAMRDDDRDVEARNASSREAQTRSAEDSDAAAAALLAHLGL